jgi:hypothetical protein
MNGRRHRYEIPVAVNDKKGAWRVVAIDVGGQERAEASFEVT